MAGVMVHGGSDGVHGGSDRVHGESDGYMAGVMGTWRE